MPDDQTNNASAIDDLVKELSKSNNSNQSRFSPNQGSSTAMPSGLPLASINQEPPLNLPGVKIENKPAVPPAPLHTQNQTPPNMPKSSASMLPKLEPGLPRPLAPTPMSTARQANALPMASSNTKTMADEPIGAVRSSSVQEYRSSIRTMGEDITSIKSGQKPLGVDVPRRVTPDIPKASEISRPKAQAPLPSGPISSVGLGRTERTGSLPELPKPTISLSMPGSIAGLGQAGKTGPLPPPVPQKPADSRQTRPEPFNVPTIQPSITVPSEKKGLSMMFFLVIAGTLAVGGFSYWYLVLKVSEPEVIVSPTPTPTQTVSSTPVINDLSDIFSGVPINFEIISNANRGDFRVFVDTLTITGGNFLKIDLFESGDPIVPLNWMDMVDLAQSPFNDVAEGGYASFSDSITLVYGQLEMFNKDGSTNFNTQDIKRVAFVAEVTDSAEVEAIMRNWELALANDLDDYFSIDDTSKEASVNFLDNTYRGTAIRYKNFPFPDTTIDYSIVSAAGQNYLVIAGSREMMYAVIDVLLAP